MLKKIIKSNALVLACILVLAQIASAIGFAQEAATCTISINRSTVPDLYFKNLSIRVTVNDASDIQVMQNGISLPYTQDDSRIIVTTNQDQFVVTMTAGSNSRGLCDTDKAPLLNDKRWTWTHGFDDNVNLFNSIQEFRAKSWPATMYVIAGIYDPIRNTPLDIIDETYVNDFLLPEGWVLGNHTSRHENFDKPPAEITFQDYVDDITSAQATLEASIARSSVPDLQVISFAVPNFSPWYSDPFAEAAPSTGLLLYETGNTAAFQVGSDQPFLENGQVAIPALGTNTIIGRDGEIESNPIKIKSNMDYFSRNSSETVRFWYNTLSHGNKEANIKIVVDHVYDNYGPGGTDEVWVTTSTEMYSYILTRDNATITVIKDTPATDSFIFLPLTRR